MVSNHGGRQVDGAVGALDALPAVADAVGSRLAVLFDSGIRGGADMLKALALGAQAVLIGRPYATAWRSAARPGFGTSFARCARVRADHAAVRAGVSSASWDRTACSGAGHAAVGRGSRDSDGPSADRPEASGRRPGQGHPEQPDRHTSPQLRGRGPLRDQHGARDRGRGRRVPVVPGGGVLGRVSQARGRAGRPGPAGLPGLGQDAWSAWPSGRTRTACCAWPSFRTGGRTTSRSALTRSCSSRTPWRSPAISAR